MSISIHHTYSTSAEVLYYTKTGYTLHCRVYGQMDDIAEQVCDILVNHDFSRADVCSAETGEILMVIERT